MDNPYTPGEKSGFILEKDGKKRRIPVRGQELYWGEVVDLEDAVLEGKTPRVSLQDSRGNVASIVACLESARTGHPVSVGSLLSLK